MRVEIGREEKRRGNEEGRDCEGETGKKRKRRRRRRE